MQGPLHEPMWYRRHARFGSFRHGRMAKIRLMVQSTSSRGHRRDERAEIVRLLLVRPPGDADPGKLLLRELDVGKPFGVLQVDIVLGLVLLDEVVFKEERLGLGVRDHHGDRRDVRDERFGLCVVILFLEVTRHPFFEVLCLPDVDDRPVFCRRRGSSPGRGGGWRDRSSVILSHVPEVIRDEVGENRKITKNTN